jgi:hypothetical protein
MLHCNLSELRLTVDLTVQLEIGKSKTAKRTDIISSDKIKEFIKIELNWDPKGLKVLTRKL